VPFGDRELAGDQDGGVVVPVLDDFHAAVRDLDGNFLAVQRTFLHPDGTGKMDVDIAKSTLGKFGGGAVQLGLPGDELLPGNLHMRRRSGAKSRAPLVHAKWKAIYLWLPTSPGNDRMTIIYNHSGR